MDQPLKSPGQSTAEDAFHRLFELSRTTPAPSLEERLDRLARLRAAVAGDEARLIQAISADFGHRSATETETTIAETSAAGEVDAVHIVMFRPSFRGDAKHRTSDVPLHIGESLDSGSGPSDHPGMTNNKLRGKYA
jgi:hypothetical protein